MEYATDLDEIVDKLENKIEGVILNNEELLRQPGMSEYYRQTLTKDIRQAKIDLENVKRAYYFCNRDILTDYVRVYLRESTKLEEADKSRFINRLWLAAGCDAIDCRAYNRYDLDQMIDFFNKYQNVKVDWQSKATNIVTLWNIMDDYYNSQANKGGKDNAKALFKDTEKFEKIYENENWLFVAPLNYEAAIDMNSYKIGGQGAKWCIGTKGDSSYWGKYIKKEKSAFVMAYCKSSWASPTAQKYMLQIQEAEVTVWPQDDNPSKTFGIAKAEEYFDITWQMMKDWYNHLFPKIFSSIVPTVETFSIEKVMNKQETYNLSKSTEYSSIHLDSFECDGNLDTTLLKQQVVGIEKVNELYYSAAEFPMRSSSGEQVLLFPVFRCVSANPERQKFEITKPNICLADLDLLAIGKFYLGSEDRGPRLWFKTKKLAINNLYIPKDSNEKEIQQMIDSRATPEDILRRYARLSDAIDLSDVTELVVNNVYLKNIDNLEE